MGKKLLGIVVSVLMIFGLFGITSCVNMNLDDYKAIKSAELQDYADAKKVICNYSENGLVAINNAVIEGKKAIEDATTKPEVITEYNNAKIVIDAIKDDILAVPFTIGCQEIYYYNYGTDLNFLKIVRSLEELIQLCDEHECAAFQENHPCYEWELSEKIRGYEKNFFEENALVLYFFIETDDYPVKVDSVVIQNDVLTLYIASPLEGEAHKVISSWAIIVEVKKSDIINITEIKIEQIGKGEFSDYKAL